MAGKVGSASFQVLLCDGLNLLAVKVKNVSHKIESVLEATLGLSDLWEGHNPTGNLKATITQDGGFFDDTTAGFHETFNSAAKQQTKRILCFAFAGNTVGAPFVGCQGVYGQAYEVLGTGAQLTKANVTYGLDGQVDRGRIVQPWATNTASWNTKTLGTTVDYTTDPSQRVVPITSNSKATASVVTCPVPHGLAAGHIVLISGVAGSSPTINGSRAVTVIDALTFSVPVDTSGAGTAGTGGTFVLCNSLNGGAGYQQVSDLTGFTGFIGKLQDSTDDTTYGDLVVFTNVTAALKAERKTAAGTVDRYLSYGGAVTGSGSIKAFSGFSRS
jgi:hypothetical protein